MLGLSKICLVSLLVVAGFLVSSCDAGVSPEPTLPATGKIVFVSDLDGNFEIYVMNADGSNQTRLTNNLTDDVMPAWSP